MDAAVSTWVDELGPVGWRGLHVRSLELHTGSDEGRGSGRKNYDTPSLLALSASRTAINNNDNRKERDS
jgi:hypothetical protein